MKTTREKIGCLPIPGWLAGVVTVVYCEILLHLWVAAEVPAGYTALLLLFALGFGCVLGLALSFIGHKKWGKRVTAALLVLVTAVYLVFFFVTKFFTKIMAPSTILAGAGNILGDANMWRETAALVLPNFWRILLMLLPAIGYGLFAKPVKTSWRTRMLGLVAALVIYGSCFGLVRCLPGAADQMGQTYNFENATQQFGLNVSLVLEAVHGGQTGGFVVEMPQETEPAPESSDPGSEPGTDPTEPEYPLNVMDFDFEALAAAAPNPAVANIHRYVAGLRPTAQNEYTGLLKGKNLIFITAESLSSPAIDKDLTPTLYRLANEGIRFEDYYQPAWASGTTGGEFSNLTGLVPTTGGSCMFEPKQQDMFLLIGRQLQAQGYSSAAYHNNDYKFYKRNVTHTYLGYDTYMGWGNGMQDGVEGTWPQSDLQMVDFTLPKHLENTPFSLYYMSVSGHCMYYLKGNAMGRKNIAAVESWMADKGLEHSEPVKCYLAANLELEYALESMLRQLEEAGILEDTVIVISPDHIPYRLTDSESLDRKMSALGELYGAEPHTNPELDRNTLVIWSPCLEDLDLVVEEPTYSLDILPTLSNLFGLEFDSRLLVGRDVLAPSEPLVLWPDFSWKTGLGYYDGLSGVFTPAEGASPTEEDIRRIKNTVQNKLHYSAQVLDLDYFNYLAPARQ